MNSMLQKPSGDEWIRWSQVVVERLTDIVHIYNTQSPDSGFMPQKERQLKSGLTLETLRKLHALADGMASPPVTMKTASSVAARQEEEEGTIQAVVAVFSDILQRLPAWSADMQLIMRSPWHSNFPSRAAREIFLGASDNEAEGIGSGHVEHGRLPEKLQELLEREHIEGERPVCDGVSSAIGKGDHAQTETSRRWTERQGAFMRSAGRMN